MMIFEPGYTSDHLGVLYKNAGPQRTPKLFVFNMSELGPRNLSFKVFSRESDAQLSLKHIYLVSFKISRWSMQCKVMGKSVS